MGGRGGASRLWGNGEGRSSKNIFSALRASFCSKNNGKGGPPGPLPWIRHWTATIVPQDCRAGEHVTCERARLLCALTRNMLTRATILGTANIPSPSFEVGSEKVNSSLEELINIRVTIFITLMLFRYKSLKRQVTFSFIAHHLPEYCDTLKFWSCILLHKRKDPFEIKIYENTSLAVFILMKDMKVITQKNLNRFYRPEVSYRLVHTKQCHNKKKRS